MSGRPGVGVGLMSEPLRTSISPGDQAKVRGWGSTFWFIFYPLSHQMDLLQLLELRSECVADTLPTLQLPRSQVAR